MEGDIIVYLVLGTIGATAMLAVLERSLDDLIDSAVAAIENWTEKLVAAIETGCAWLRQQTEGVIQNVSGDMFWGSAVAAALWNLALAVAFAFAEYGLILLTLRAAGLSDQQSVLPFGVGFLTGVAFLACSVFYFEMLLELAGVGNFSGIWQRANAPVKRGLIAMCVVCLSMVLTAGAIFGVLRGAAFDATPLSGEFLGIAHRTWLVVATVEITLGVFVACGLAGWSVVRSLLHLYGVGAAVLHGLLAATALSLRLWRTAFGAFCEVLKRVLAVATAPWRALHSWLSRYPAIRQALRLELSETGERTSIGDVAG